ncbi:hypothetical protein Pmani_018436 [Petrolisthes manimaculis]|uniref:Uncharacterized protein n=1 Tax=Petrolisthes manimaculis TaxID=1843537 RepID=A0AAE1PK86_9EUCA|nr:hypothetical protein Pmani_018436 [Petrolisthes manimaculis]
MGEVDGDVNIEVASEFVCKMLSQPKVRSVDEARYNKLMQMTGKIDQDKPLTNIKRIDCALLPPSRRALDKKLQRAQYVSILWNHANFACPDQGLMVLWPYPPPGTQQTYIFMTPDMHVI